MSSSAALRIGSRCLFTTAFAESDASDRLLNQERRWSSALATMPPPTAAAKRSLHGTITSVIIIAGSKPNV